MDYQGNRHSERFTYRCVSWPLMVEYEEFPQITGGSIEKSAFTSVKESGSLSYAGEEAPDDRNLVRIYYSFTDDDGETAQHALATMRMSASEPSYETDMVSGTLNLYGLLQVLSDKQYGMPFTVQKGTKTVEFARNLCTGLGLKVNAASSSYVSSSDHTFDEDASYLDIVNWCLDVAGFSSAYTDAYGTIQMQKYVAPLKKTPRFTFRDDVRSIMYPKVIVSNDLDSTPNVCRMYYQTEEESLWAAASNIDPLSPASTVSRSAEKTMFESVNELTGSTKAARLEELKNKSLTKLIDNSSEIEYLTLDCAWLPLDINDNIAVEYTRAELTWSGTITNMTINLGIAAKTIIKARNYVMPALKTEVTGGSL